MAAAILSQPPPHGEQLFSCTDATGRTRNVLLTRSEDQLVLLNPPPGTAELSIGAAEALRDALDQRIAEIRTDNAKRLRGFGIGGPR